MKIQYLDSSIVIPYVSALIGTRAQRADRNNLKARQYVRSARAILKISVAVYAETMRHFQDNAVVDDILQMNFPRPCPSQKPTPAAGHACKTDRNASWVTTTHG